MTFSSPKPNQMWQLLVLVNPGRLASDSTGFGPDGSTFFQLNKVAFKHFLNVHITHQYAEWNCHFDRSHTRLGI